jgi:hypothetical protein
MNEIVNPKPLLITIGSHPTNSLNLDQELKLLKAAILYGDRVELYSLKASMFGLILKLKNTPASLQLHLLEEISPYFMQEFDNEEFHDKLQMYKHALPEGRYLLQS